MHINKSFVRCFTLVHKTNPDPKRNSQSIPTSLFDMFSYQINPTIIYTQNVLSVSFMDKSFLFVVVRFSSMKIFREGEWTEHSWVWYQDRARKGLSCRYSIVLHNGFLTLGFHQWNGYLSFKRCKLWMDVA